MAARGAVFGILTDLSTEVMAQMRARIGTLGLTERVLDASFCQPRCTG
jgi:hypothetical protein